jgi:ubiquinone/menaquinone biosynthesis C-methylase UbiE
VSGDLHRSIRRFVRQASQQAGAELTGPVGSALALATNTYEALCEAVAKAFSNEDAVGGGSFDLVGRIELSLLLMEGLKPTDILLDFGCGTGRLAVRAIPVLTGGHYIGADISQTMLEKARLLVTGTLPLPACKVSWVQQTTSEFPLPQHSVDLVCAFSVFTHMEHEDSYRYLKDALRIVRPGGRFVFSCLPLSVEYARDVFLASARERLHERWSKVRNVTTSVDLMTAIAELAGWRVLRWYPGDELRIQSFDTGEWFALGQSASVLEAPE